MNTTIYLSRGYDDGDNFAFCAPFISRSDAEREGHYYDRSEIVEIVIRTGAPAGYVLDHNGHALWTYVRSDGMVLGIYPPHHPDHDAEHAWYVVGRDGELPIYEGNDPTSAYLAASAPMGEIVH